MLFGNRNYRWWFAADTASVIAGSVRTLALSLAAFEITGSTTLAGVLGTALMLKTFAFTLPGGVFVDRHHRTTLMRVRGVLSCAIWGLLAVLIYLGALDYWMLAAAVVLQAILAIVQFVAVGLASIGPLLSGLLLELGTLTIALMVAVIALGVAAVIAVSSRRIRSIPLPSQWADDAQ